MTTIDFLFFLPSDIRQVIIGYISLENIIEWKYDVFLSASFLLQKTRHDYQYLLHDPTKVTDWKATCDYILDFYTRRAKVEHLSFRTDRDLLELSGLQRQEWNLHFSSTQYAKIKDFTLGDIIFILVEKTRLVYVFMVEMPCNTLILQNYGSMVSDHIYSLPVIWKLPLNFWIEVRLPSGKRSTNVFPRWIMEKPPVNCEIVKRLEFYFHGVLVFLGVFVYENISYGIIVSHFNQTNLSLVAVRHPLPDYWRIELLCEQKLSESLRLHNLSSNRILIEEVVFQKWDKKVRNLHR